MFLFMIKKTFFDWWDNFFLFFLLNIGYLLILGLIVSISSPFQDSLLASFLIFFLKSELFFVYTGAVARITKDISDYHSVNWATFFQHLKSSYKTSLLFGALLTYLLFSLSLLIPFYQQAQALWEMIGVMFYFWIVIGTLFIAQWFFPVEARFQSAFAQNLKKCLLLFLDNSVFSIGLWIGSIVLLLLSIVTGFLLFGMATVLLWLNVALKLRMYKYDYLESRPEANRQDIPWAELIRNDQEILGKRTIRGFFFPWKD